MESKEMPEAVSNNKIKKGFIYLKKHGLIGFLKEIKKRITSPYNKYNKWFKLHKVTSEELELQRKHKFEYEPLISILVPTYRTPEKLLRQMVASVTAQSYANWQLCIADGSCDGSITKILEELSAKDSRIVFKTLESNEGISGNTNRALELATGEYIGLLDHDDIMEPNALFEVVSVLQDKAVDIVYTDEDKVNNKLTKYLDPNFKPDFSIDLFRSHNYITHFFVVKINLMREVGGFRSAFDGSQDYDLMFRCIEKAGKIVHVPKVLYHWRLAKGSTADNPENKLYCYEAGQHAIEEHYKRVGIKAKVSMTDMWGMYHTVYEVVDNPLVSIIIPNKDHIEDLDTCIRSIENKSS